MSNNDDAAIAGVVHIGGLPLKTKKHTMVFHFHKFENLDEKKYKTPRIFCHGFHWYLRLHPNGICENSRGHVSLYLHCEEVGNGTVESVQAMYSVRAMNHPLSISKVVGPFTLSKQTFTARGLKKLWSRDRAISFCDARGTLVLEASLEVCFDEQDVNCWKPGKSINTQVASLYDSKNYADATFVIGSRRRERQSHRLILKLRAPTLAGMLVDDAANQAEVPITGVDPDLFEVMIRFLYKEDLPTNFSDEDSALELLKLADKFGCSDLKMLLEARIIETPSLFCVQTAADLVLLADAKNCALLLERSLKLIVENASDVAKTEGWQHVKESSKLMEMIVLAQSNPAKTNPTEHSVSVLRKRAFEQGLDADGSREDLVKRLKANTDEEAASS